MVKVTLTKHFLNIYCTDSQHSMLSMDMSHMKYTSPSWYYWNYGITKYGMAFKWYLTV